MRTVISVFIDLQYCPKLSPRERCYVFEGTWKGGDKEKKALTVKVTSWFLLFNSYIRPQWLQVGYVENDVIPFKDGGRNWHFTFCLFFVSFVGSYSVSALTHYLLKWLILLKHLFLLHHWITWCNVTSFWRNKIRLEQWRCALSGEKVGENLSLHKPHCFC